MPALDWLPLWQFWWWTDTAAPAAAGPAGCGTGWGSPGESAPVRYRDAKVPPNALWEMQDSGGASFSAMCTTFLFLHFSTSSSSSIPSALPQGPEQEADMKRTQRRTWEMRSQQSGGAAAAPPSAAPPEPADASGPDALIP